MTVIQSRALVTSLIICAALMTAPRVFADGNILFDVDTKSDKLPVIVVDGDNNRYTKVLTKELKFYVAVRTSYPKKAKEKTFGSIAFEGKRATSILGTSAEKVYAVVVPYMDPRSRTVENERLSAVGICNQNLNRGGEFREKMLKKGMGPITIHDAYLMTVTQGYKYKKLGFLDFGSIKAEHKIPVRLRCMNLVGPKPRTKTTTRGGSAAPRAREHKPVPLVSELKLRAEPAAVKDLDGLLCPTQMKLYGFVRVSRNFEGKAIMFGPGFLSTPTELNMKAGKNVTVRATYPVKWGITKGLAAPGAGGSLRNQTVGLTLNVADQNNKVVRSTGKRNFKITCKPKPVP